MYSTLVSSWMDIAGKESSCETKPLVRLAFSVIVAMAWSSDGASNVIFEFDKHPSQTCILWYGAVRETSRCEDAPIADKKELDSGVSEDTLLVKPSAEGDQERVAESD